MYRHRSGVAVKAGEDVRVYTAEGSDLHIDIHEQHNICDDLSPSAQYQTSVECIPVWDLFDIKGWVFKFDDERPIWWTDRMTAQAKEALFKDAMNYWQDKTLKWAGNLDLNNLTTLAEGVTLEAGKGIYCCKQWYHNIKGLRAVLSKT